MASSESSERTLFQDFALCFPKAYESICPVVAVRGTRGVIGEAGTESSIGENGLAMIGAVFGDLILFEFKLGDVPK